jgi:D-beta-D-heptose 7-phosphate kinase/D-beta-D-heptose 1-phosphate adenosyltransferase
LTNGCYDIFHAGHARLLTMIKFRHPGHMLIVAVNSDASVRRLKGEDKPVMPQDERMYVVSCHRAVDAVVPFDEDTPIKVVEALRPMLLVKGGDWAIQNIVGGKEVESWGGTVETIPLALQGGQPISTSSLIQKIVRAFIREQGCG